MKTLTKDELSIIIHEEYGITKTMSREIVDTVFDEITSNLKSEGETYIYEFGKFKVRHREARQGFNPHTKEEMNIEAQNAPVFEAAKRLRDEVNKASQ